MEAPSLAIAVRLLALIPLGWTETEVGNQESLPIVKATSTRVDVQDGHNDRKGHWTVDPSLDLDVYYAQRSHGPKPVTFRTDLDAISFVVEPGKDYDFVILLNNKHACRTRISTLRRPCHRVGSDRLGSPAEIPFTLGDDDRIRVEGRINDSQPLVFLFDTGADTTVIHPSALDKGLKVAFDGTMLNSGLGGQATRETSNDNRLAVADLRWDHEQVMLIEKRQGDGIDGILGINVFEDKVVEIDYDRRVMTIREALPTNTNNYVEGELRFRGTSPFVETTLDSGTKRVTDWLLLDTGYTASVHLTRDFWSRHGLGDSLTRLAGSRSHGVGAQAVEGEYFALPGLALGDLTLRNVPTNVETEPKGDAESTGLVGMEVLKRFDTILDFRTNRIYLKPNGLLAAPFRDPIRFRNGAILAGVAGTVALLAIGAVCVRRRFRLKGRPGAPGIPA